MSCLHKPLFIEKWKAINKSGEHKFQLGKLSIEKEASVIKILQANNIVGSAYKTGPNNTVLIYFNKLDKTLYVLYYKR